MNISNEQPTVALVKKFSSLLHPFLFLANLKKEFALLHVFFFFFSGFVLSFSFFSWMNIAIQQPIIALAIFHPFSLPGETCKSFPLCDYFWLLLVPLIFLK
jgi:hypothetical protein